MQVYLKGREALCSDYCYPDLIPLEIRRWINKISLFSVRNNIEFSIDSGINTSISERRLVSRLKAEIEITDDKVFFVEDRCIFLYKNYSSIFYQS